MSDDGRLLEGSSSDPISRGERELLGSLRPDPATRDAVWERMSGAILAGGAVTAVTTQGAAATVSWTGKLLVALAIAAPLGGGAYYLAKSDDGAQVAAATPPAKSPATEAMAPNRVAAETTPAPSDVAPLDAAPSGSTQDEPSSTEPKRVVNSGATAPGANAPPTAHALEEENRLLREARSAHRQGDEARARSLLAEMARRFPRGALGQEREFLRVQIALASGEAGAAELGRRFVSRYPTSPYRERVEALLAPRVP
ncbi:MAG TPA: hypothetical protein VLC09_10895 [Polyangiaceae bacterium]|nr:hypothetical protein [Polyangiaceae bacterium]